MILLRVWILRKWKISTNSDIFRQQDRWGQRGFGRHIVLVVNVGYTSINCDIFVHFIFIKNIYHTSEKYMSYLQRLVFSHIQLLSCVCNKTNALSHWIDQLKQVKINYMTRPNKENIKVQINLIKWWIHLRSPYTVCVKLDWWLIKLMFSLHHDREMKEV